MARWSQLRAVVAIGVTFVMSTGQYTLAYEARDEAGWGTRFRQLLVRVLTRPDAIVRTRRGYDPPRSGRR